MEKIYIAGCGGMLGLAFYKEFKDNYIMDRGDGVTYVMSDEQVENSPGSIILAQDKERCELILQGMGCK